MDFGVFFPSAEHAQLDEMVAKAGAAAALGIDSLWLPQSSSFDALTALVVIGRETPDVALGTAVIPTFPRHPAALAAQAMTANAALSGRLVLGVGLSHKAVVEDRYGLSYDRPAAHMREYLSVLLPLVETGESDFTGERVTGRVQLSIPGTRPLTVCLAALQPGMLRLAGARAGGTITWCTGPVTLAEQIVPTVTAAATEAGRPPPRVVVALPCCVTDDVADGRSKADAQLDGYGRIPVYRAVLDREGVESPGDVAVVGDERSVRDQLWRLEDIGATDFVAILCGTTGDRSRTSELLADVRRGLR